MSTPLDVIDSPDCGNAPRKAVLRDIAIGLARADAAALGPYLADDAVWTLVGDRDLTGAQEIRAWAASAPRAAELRFASVLTHGPEASMSGTVTLASGERTFFSHVLRFASAGKSAKAKRVTSYLISA
ncbi:nuclear transport factor 2 family protein [Demequina aurantiaca]|uniref:nuclear transport factor 2 family protein n=1 Tax=Demequina aurantiaca TaxID=676200 RepID=UPI00078380C1|nr:nuclear transport factor 2 family protein [Demequina aurantiaca]